MTHDHEAVQLAVASLDFELTPAEQTRMEAGLAACPECAAIAASHLHVQGSSSSCLSTTPRRSSDSE